MPDKLYRAQILLEPSQHAELREIAAREGRSISEVARAMLELGLRQAEIEKQRRLDVLDQVTELRLKIAEEHGAYLGQPVADVRAEREAELTKSVDLQGP